MAPVQPARLVTRNAITARRLAPSADPALNPNHPNQRKTVPSMTLAILCGRCDLMTPFGPVPDRGPRTMEYASAPKPLDISTGPPPAKSRTPHLYAQPVGFQIQHALLVLYESYHRTVNKGDPDEGKDNRRKDPCPFGNSAE
jgi:hypothetical protein